MALTEIPSSVKENIIRDNPQEQGPGTASTTINDKQIIEREAHKRRTSSSVRRVFHLRNKANGEKPSTTMVLTPGEHYNTLIRRADDKNISTVVAVNSTHIRFGFKDVGKEDASFDRKFGFNGAQLIEDGPASQLPLGLYEDVEEPVEQTVPNISSLPEIPDELDPKDISFVKQVLELAFDIKKIIPHEDLLKLGDVFNPSPTPTPMQAELPIILS